MLTPMITVVALAFKRSRKAAAFHTNRLNCTVKRFAHFSKVPKLYGPFSGVTIPFVSQKRRGFNSSNFTVMFLLVTLKTC